MTQSLSPQSLSPLPLAPFGTDQDAAETGGDTGKLFALPVYDNDQIADYLTDGFWTDNGEIPHAFSLAANGGVITFDVTALTASGKTLARAALQAWSEVTGIPFVEVTSGYGTADINFDDSDSGAYAYSTYSFSGVIDQSFVNISTGWLGAYGIGIDSYSYQTYLHEIGHALGLGHAGDYNGSASYPADAHYANDSWQATLMSYFDPITNTFVDADYGFAITPMIADIIAIQNLYGAATGTRTGNTTYGDGNNTGNTIWNMSGTAMLTLYDSGGTDTIDLSSRTTAQRLDLSPESISDLNGRTGNFSIARGVTIENATTGSGNDTITGNDAANLLITNGGADSIDGGGGNDRLEGGTGNDFLDGGDGDDELLAGTGNDTIWGGAGIDNIAASDGDDVADGGADNDRMGGGLGNDTLDGGDGDDFMGGGDGDDVVRGGSGNDVVNGGSGVDRLEGGDGNDTMGGSFHNDTIYGDGGHDDIGGGAGADLIYGGTGNDTVGGGAGMDTIYGEAGADFLAGGDGADWLDGGGDNDRLNGGAGNDSMTGGGGADTFIFTAFTPGETDTVLDFEDGIDRFQITGIPGSTLQARLDALNLTDTATGVTMTYNGHVIHVDGIAAAELTLDDFTFI